MIWEASFASVAPSHRAAHYDEMNRVIAALHAVDYDRLSLADYGKPGGYFTRQIARWTRQYRQDEAAGRNEDMEALVEWLPTAIPPGGESTIVHGDFRCDNMIFHPT